MFVNLLCFLEFPSPLSSLGRCINQFVSFLFRRFFPPCLCYRMFWFMVFIPMSCFASCLSILTSTSKINRWSTSSNFHWVCITCQNCVFHSAAPCTDFSILGMCKREPIIIHIRVLSFLRLCRFLNLLLYWGVFLSLGGIRRITSLSTLYNGVLKSAENVNFPGSCNVAINTFLSQW
jgi:hypothetical protein